MSDVPAPVLQLLEFAASVPAFVRDGRLTVVASNTAARRLSEGFEPGVNLARFVFFDPATEASATDWPELSGQVVALLRSSAEAHRDDGTLTRLIGELASKDQTFADVWAHDRRRAPQSAVLEFEHDTAGRLRLWYQQLTLPDDLTLVLWHAADPASEAALLDLVGVGFGEGPVEG